MGEASKVPYKPTTATLNVIKLPRKPMPVIRSLFFLRQPLTDYVTDQPEGTTNGYLCFERMMSKECSSYTQKMIRPFSESLRHHKASTNQKQKNV